MFFLSLLKFCMLTEWTSSFPHEKLDSWKKTKNKKHPDPQNTSVVVLCGVTLTFLPTLPPLWHISRICILVPWQRLMSWFSGCICLWGRQLFMLETTCPGASHARRMTDCLCTVFSWVVFISSVSLWYCSPDHYRTCISKVCQNSWSGAKRWTSKWEGIYTVNPVTNPIYIYRRPCFGLLHMLMPGNSHFSPAFFVHKTIRNTWFVCHNCQGHVFHIFFEIE